MIKKLIPLLMILLLSCKGLDIRIANLDASLPQESPIVFLNQKDLGEYQLGFINPDGSGLLYLPKDSQRTFAYPFYPIWTDDGKEIMFRDAHQLNLMTVSSNGYEQDFDLHLFEIPSLIQDDTQTAVFASRDDHDNDYLYQGDLKNGKQLQIYLKAASYPTSPVRLSLGTRAINHDQLVYQRQWYTENSIHKIANEIAIYDLLTGETKILIHQEGEDVDVTLKAPSFSPNGQWIAYTAADGIYIISSEGSSPRHIVEIPVADREIPGYGKVTWYAMSEYPPIPSWSPDSKWIVYHRCMLPLSEFCERGADFNIYKVNIDTGEEVLLVEDGLNPYWRLTPVEETQSP